MASGSDSEGSVQFVEDEAEGEVSVCEPKASSSRRGNFCLEKDGVPQPIPSSTRVTRPSGSGSEGPSVLPNSHRSKRMESEGGPRGPPPKRGRQLQARETNTDADVVEVEQTVEAGSISHGFAPTSSNQQKTRSSLRLQQKRETKPEYNLTQVRQDRAKRESNRQRGRLPNRDVPEKGNSVAKVDPIEVLDDEEERQQSIPSKLAKGLSEQQEHRNGAREGLRNSPQPSEHNNEVVSVEEEEEEEEERQSKDTGGVDAPYTGSTHLIFEFPPGERGKIRVTEEERGRLSQRKYLNDSLIDFYIKYHQSDIERRAGELRISATFFSSFFFGRLRRTEPIDYDGVKGWTKKDDIFTKQYVFVPICDSYHWSLIIVANLDKLHQWVDCSEEVSQSSTEGPRIIYLDSLDPKRGTEFGETMRQYLVEEYLAKKLRIERSAATRKATSASFKRVIPILRPNVPIQTNEYDCGLYLLNSFEMFLHNTDGLRDKLLSGCRDVRNAYSHVEITMLRKNIINLMDILESQWIVEQFPRGEEPTERPQDDVKGSATEENIAARTEICASGSWHESADGVEKLQDGSKGGLTSPDQKTAEREASVPCQSQLGSTDGPEHVSLLDTRDAHNSQPEKTQNRDVNMETEVVPDVSDTKKQAVNTDLNTLSHSNLPRMPKKNREEDLLRDSTLAESTDRTRDDKERVTYYYSEGIEEVSSRRYDEEMSRAPNDGHVDVPEVLEIDTQDSSRVNDRHLQPRFHDDCFSLHQV